MKERFQNSGISPLYSPNFDLIQGDLSNKYKEALTNFFNDKRGCFF